MHSQCTAPNHVYKDVDTGQVASDLVSCIGIQPPTIPSQNSLESPHFHCVFPYTLNRDLKLSSHNELVVATSFCITYLADFEIRSTK
jgi:hypothetical protein